MVYFNMGIINPSTSQSHDIEWQEYTSDNTVTKTKKKVFEDNEWKEKTYYRLTIKLNQGVDTWCLEHYGQSTYPGLWQHLKASGYVVLEEKVYVHWKLSQ